MIGKAACHALGSAALVEIYDSSIKRSEWHPCKIVAHRQADDRPYRLDVDAVFNGKPWMIYGAAPECVKAGLS